ncbi:MAG: hypothetical protein FWD77_01980 [Betaproteobacteria bacterium]|nr:hypothetical protein [Betaproteobacteria bacterium]
MRPEDLTVDIRSRTPWEALDLGLALIQQHRRAVYAAWLTALLPALALAAILGTVLGEFFGNSEGSSPQWRWQWQLAILVLWWLKPFYDRVLLLVLSRAVFGEMLRWRAVLRAFPDIFWRSGLLRDLSWRRFNPLRSFHIPVWQLEGLKEKARRRRFQVLGRNASGTAFSLLFVCSIFEQALFLGALIFVYILIPPEFASSSFEAFFSESAWPTALISAGFLFAISTIEPLYAAAGFSLYLNRRAELEGWDIELGFRTLAARLEQENSREKMAA